MKCIAGALTPDAGVIRFADRDLTRAAPSERARAGLSIKFQITSVLPALSVYDNILLALQAPRLARVAAPLGHATGTARVRHDRARAIPAARPGRSARGRALARRAAMAGDRDGARDRSDPSPAGRAHRRDEPRGAPSHRRAARADQEPLRHPHRRARPRLHPRRVRRRSRCSTRAACWTPARSRPSRPAPRCRRSTSPVSDAPLLAVRGLSTYYGHSQALFDVDLVAGQRGAVAVLGRNGAGKTTLLRTHRGRADAAARADRLRGPRRHPHADRAARAAWPRVRAAGARGLRPAVRA